jgi:hypothetical protein
MNALTPVPQAVRAFREANGQDNLPGSRFYAQAATLSNQDCDRADGFSEYTLKPSCVKISICHRSGAAQDEIAEDRLMLIAGV